MKVALAKDTIDRTEAAAKKISQYVKFNTENNIPEFRTRVDQLICNDPETMILTFEEPNAVFIVSGEAVAKAYNEDEPCPGVYREHYRRNLVKRIAEGRLDGIYFIRRVA